MAEWKGEKERREGKKRRRGLSHTQKPEGAALFQHDVGAAPVNDDVIMAGIDELPICSMNAGDATVDRLRQRTLP
ncbi:hypothetical protein N7463_003565 [Penicillium fimorum]|uniref:Uncharacterized protein n=1 Tax=Penicillium fimorum TaxID=1882269 RepID=A0A9W9Y1G3_9EURO|nr:hypothetical protein N7463_003565 [Penicillium fimorum]